MSLPGHSKTQSGWDAVWPPCSSSVLRVFCVSTWVRSRLKYLDVTALPVVPRVSCSHTASRNNPFKSCVSRNRGKYCIRVHIVEGVNIWYRISYHVFAKCIEMQCRCLIVRLHMYTCNVMPSPIFNVVQYSQHKAIQAHASYIEKVLVEFSQSLNWRSNLSLFLGTV